MREIKFRAWDKVNGRMFPEGFSVSQDGLEVYDDNWQDLAYHLILMQYTGFHNNGQDWYEGDILESDSEWYQIEWDDEIGRWEAVGIRGLGHSIALSELLSQETWVQGNIFEKPELLAGV